MLQPGTIGALTLHSDLMQRDMLTAVLTPRKSVACRVFGPVVTLKEWIQRKASGADVSGLDFKLMALQLLKVGLAFTCFMLHAS